MDDAFSRINAYRQRNNQGASAMGGMGQYGGQMQSVRDAYWQRIEQERMKAQAQRNAFNGAIGNLSFNMMGGGRPGGGGGGGGGAPPAPGDLNAIKRYVADYAAKKYGWRGSEWDALHDLIQRESSWNPGIKNPNSSAWGLFQFIKGTSQNYGIPHGTASYQQQTDAGLRYILDRYRSPSAALAHWKRRVPINGKDVGNWY